MDTDRNLLFGVLAMQADVLDADHFIKACTLWTTRKEVSLPDLLIELGWITPADRADVDRLLERKLQKHRSFGDQPEPDGSTAMVTVDAYVRPHERYSLARLHASGGIGRIWLARDNEFGRDVALKELRPERASQPTQKARFLQEARITGQLEHPGIVPVYELAQRSDDQQPFYTMRFVKGRTLTDAARAYHRNRIGGDAAPLEL
jgi:eukaryotic-like serine/threonine-protein kinase